MKDELRYQIQCSTAGYPILCPVCGKALTPATNDEPCPDTPYRHGRHALFVYEMKPEPSYPRDPYPGGQF